MTAETKDSRCSYCQRQLNLGVDVWTVLQGVLGPRGFVPLEEMIYFCGEECLRDYFNGSTEETQRIP